MNDKEYDIHEANDYAIELINSLPCPKELKAVGVHAIEQLTKMEVELVGIFINGTNRFALYIPLTCSLFNQYHIDMWFSMEDSERPEGWLSCGPSSGEANNEGVDSYLKWLDKHMPRRGMTNREIFAAGNPDGLIMPHVSDLVSGG